MTDRLIAFDFDSTLIPVEVIDELARAAGKFDEVAALTRNAMEGSLDFETAMRLRLATMAGLGREVVNRVSTGIELRENSLETLTVLKERGYRIAIISGGFRQPVLAILDRYDIEPDYLFANELLFDGDRFRGEAILHVHSNKGEILSDLMRNLGIGASRTVAVGDGATDVDMFREAGVSIAFNGKPAAREAATSTVEGNDLARILSHIP